MWCVARALVVWCCPSAPLCAPALIIAIDRARAIRAPASWRSRSSGVRTEIGKSKGIVARCIHLIRSNFISTIASFQRHLHVRHECMQTERRVASRCSCRAASRVCRCSRQRDTAVRACLFHLRDFRRHPLRHRHPLVDLRMSARVERVERLGLSSGRGHQTATRGQNRLQIAILGGDGRLKGGKTEGAQATQIERVSTRHRPTRTDEWRRAACTVTHA